ncbi:PaaI family thioesterase [Mesorhizobium abyssinicae]|uniref:PaaI family thioesterase n=1 Tax=Mesorhizobium abyssinicae TaxID=1209958 RepID=UPI00339A381B
MGGGIEAQSHGGKRHDANMNLSAQVDGEWNGWSRWNGLDPHEANVGPFYIRRAETGNIITGWRIAEKNLREGGATHGGAVMTFADFTLFSIASDCLDGNDGVTVSLNCEFASSSSVGQLVSGQGRVVRAGRSLIFVQGVLETEKRTILGFSGIIKIIRASP